MSTSDSIVCDAVFSEDGLYRYSAHRTWDARGPRAMFVGLNPSLAGGLEDNPTIRRVMGFARLWGCGGVDLLNLFAWRATTPKGLKQALRPDGPDNTAHLLRHARRADLVVAAWGTHGAHRGAGTQIATQLSAVADLYCLGRTQAGHPKHPLYLRKDTALESFEVGTTG